LSLIPFIGRQSQIFGYQAIKASWEGKMNRRQLLEYASLTALVAASGGIALKRGSNAVAGESNANCPPWHTHHYAPTQEYLKRAQRLPKLQTRLGSAQMPDRSTIPGELLGDYEHLLRRIDEFKKGSIIIDGEPYGVPEYSAMTVSARNGAHLSRYEIILAGLQGKPGTFTAYEHELTNAVIALDSGYYAFLGGHTMSAIAAGVRVEALVALRDHRDDGLDKDELEHVNFIRAVRDGSVNDGMWGSMKKRIGTECGVVEYTWVVLVRNALHQFCWAVGAPELPRDDFNKMLAATKPSAQAMIMNSNMRHSTDVKCMSTPWLTYNTPAKQELLKRAKRIPKLPDRGTIPEEELVAYDIVAKRVAGFKNRSPQEGTAKVDLVDGEPYAVSEWSAYAVSPLLGMHMSRGGPVVDHDEGRPGGISHIQHELIDETLALDSGYYFFLAGHTPGAMSAGVRIEALEALRDHRDDLLTRDEMQIVQFVRSVRDGGMTDDIWEGMKKSVGNEAAVVDYVCYILLLDMHTRLDRAFGCPEMSREDFSKMLNEYRSGERKAVPYAAPSERRG
jgi:hypothetical protein